MNNIEFAEKCKKLTNIITHYAKGTFGQKATSSFIMQKKKQYPSWYTTQKVTELIALDDGTLLMDCVGMIKYLLWQNKSGQVVYTSNGVPDIDETTMFNKCTSRSSDFSQIEVGEVCWMKGHIGVYVGDGMVVECTNAWTKEVLYSSFIKGKCKNYRVWEKHGKLPYIDYIKNDSFKVMQDHALLELHKNYDIVKLSRELTACYTIVETKDNFGKTSEGYWIDLTKCRRLKDYGC